MYLYTVKIDGVRVEKVISDDLLPEILGRLEIIDRRELTSEEADRVGRYSNSAEEYREILRRL